MEDDPTPPEHSIAELLKQVATTMRREGIESLTVAAGNLPPSKTGEELSALLEEAFLGDRFERVLASSVSACEAKHAAGQFCSFVTNSFRDTFVYPGKKFPPKCFIQHSRFNIQAATKLGDFLSRFCGESRINRRLACIDGFCREYENVKQAKDEVNKKDFVCILNRE